MKRKQASIPNVVNVARVREIQELIGDHWGGAWKPLTPALDALPGRLGVNLSRVPPHRTSCPFHTHARSDEVFYVLSGRGVLRYGDTLKPIRAGDCISCPAGSGIAHQLVNPFGVDLVYLAIGPNDLDEVCTYPDSGKVYVRSIKTVGYLKRTPYMDGEPVVPRILELARAQLKKTKAGAKARGRAQRSV
jgi:uncharacterized cupin superfamily protein